ncbi:kinase-like domain-containing protein [Penicillium paradoxum]|uniref:kinase-like domain-containing protein n=1 Tax=Penicillium paradoxum TaxID=176176 RepID=UPI002548FE25|nr:kinase-like domain-containing protein [Penicillium paradoxum]KAJ5787427.1 kinase-like domain-containing protein [Penicillium paradoxum]
MFSSKWTSKPRVFPTSGFELIDPSSKIEEETLPTYSPERYYPVQQGEIFDNRYQALSKLGYGVTSTAWLACDLVDSSYVVLKIYTLGQAREHELNIYNRINSVETDHPGRKFIRKMFGHFFVNGPHGRHVCLVHEPLGTNTTELLRHIPGRVMTLEGMKPAIRQLLGVLDFLHSVARIIHTDIQLKNLLLPTPSPRALSEFEQHEFNSPVGRKILKDRTIYTSSQFPSGDGLPRLCDFGEARLDHDGLRGDIMPDYYRTPEVILKGDWDCTVDIWSVAMVAWDIVCPHTIIKGEVRDGIFDDGVHIAELVALLGHPPPEFLAKKHMGWVFWDESGRWKDMVPIPDRSLEKLATNIQGEDVEGFLRWLRRAFQWNPEDRPTVMEFLTDPWLMEGLNIKKKNAAN